MGGIRLRLLAMCFIGATAMTSGVSATGCGLSTGACDSTGRYCGDSYTKSECDERSELRVNGEDWHHHPNQTCEDRGKDSTS